MDQNLILVYLAIFVGILALAGVNVFRQVVKTRKVEATFSRLRNKLSKDKDKDQGIGTVQEYYELGSIYSEKKVFSQAIALFQKALKASETEGETNIAPIFNALGYAYFAQEQYDLAIRQYKEAIKLQPDYIVALNNLAHAYERKKLHSQALDIYEEVLKLAPQNSTAKRRVESLRRLVST
jgi:tetratricopeptide (TPR) repeat protein